MIGKIRQTENKIMEQSKSAYMIHKIHFKNHIAALCIMAAVFMIFGISYIYKSHVLSRESSISLNSIHGPLMYAYYRCKGNYFSLKNASPDLQKKISKNIYGDFYEIKGVDISKSIAFFNGQYYYRLDYAFSDTVIFHEKPYLINSNAQDTVPGKYLGKAGKYKTYEIPNTDPLQAVLVKIDSIYFEAYQYPSVVEFMGVTYELEPEKIKIDAGVLGPSIGIAGSYKAYKNGNDDITKTVLIQINNTECVTAKSIIPSSKEPVPTSFYGTPQESMYGILCTVQWKNHGIYLVDSKTGTNSSDLLKQHLGKKIGRYSYYDLYEAKDADPSNYIIVKNNEVYLKYDYLFKDTISFNGNTYVISDDDPGFIKGSVIGACDSNIIYRLEGVDPSKVIDIHMSGITSSGRYSGDFTAYNKNIK